MNGIFSPRGISQLFTCVLVCCVLHAEEKGPAGFETPQAAFDAYTNAMNKADWKASWACFTTRRQDFEAVESLFGLGMHDPDYEKKYLKPDIKKPAELPKSEEERQKLLLSMLRDKLTVYAAACDHNTEDLKSIDWKEPLRKLTTIDDRARGVVMRYLESRSKSPGKPEVIEQTPWDMPIYFQKTKKGWLLDIPTPTERLLDTAAPRHSKAKE